MANTESLWQELNVAALLGTQRRAFTLPEAGSGLGSALRAAAPGQEDGDSRGGSAHDDAGRLLRAASLAAVHRRAGQLPGCQPLTLPPVCPADEWQPCSPAAGASLEVILSGDLVVLLPEWVGLAALHQRRVREEQLALLLGSTKASLPLRSALLPVLGQRGQWLARLNPDWQSFNRYDGEHTWHEGARKERLAYLNDLRAEQPARARELLAETWAQESPAERIAFLQTLSNGLSMADEPFLESVLDDRRKDVRAAAADLLGRLPASRLVQRMTARAQQLLIWKTNLLRSSLEVTLPEACNEGMQRDGIDPKVLPKAGLGEKSSWLAQILARVPPNTWSSAWKRTPEQILSTILKHNDEPALFQGWLAAASAFEDAGWLEALLVHDLRRADRTSQPDLFAQLPAELREKRMLALLRENPPLAYDQPAAIYLSACRFTWGFELTRSVARAIRLHINKADINPWQWDRLLRDIAPYLNPDLLEEAIESIKQAPKATIDPAVARHLGILNFRLEMQRAFSEEA